MNVSVVMDIVLVSVVMVMCYSFGGFFWKKNGWNMLACTHQLSLQVTEQVISNTLWIKYMKGNVCVCVLGG